MFYVVLLSVHTARAPSLNFWYERTWLVRDYGPGAVQTFFSDGTWRSKEFTELYVVRQCLDPSVFLDDLLASIERGEIDDVDMKYWRLALSI